MARPEFFKNQPEGSFIGWEDNGCLEDLFIFAFPELLLNSAGRFTTGDAIEQQSSFRLSPAIETPPGGLPEYELDAEEIKALHYRNERLKKLNEANNAYRVSRQELKAGALISGGQENDCADYVAPMCQRCAILADEEAFGRGGSVWTETQIDDAHKNECSHKNFRRINNNSVVSGHGVESFNALNSTLVDVVWSLNFDDPKQQVVVFADLKDRLIAKRDKLRNEEKELNANLEQLNSEVANRPSSSRSDPSLELNARRDVVKSKLLDQNRQLRMLKKELDKEQEAYDRHKEAIQLANPPPHPLAEPFARNRLVVAYLQALFMQLLADQERLLDELKETYPNWYRNHSMVYRYRDSAKEMCDVCLATIFNFRLFCPKCAMQVCERCAIYRFLSGGASSPKKPEVGAPEWENKATLDHLNWPLCVPDEPIEANRRTDKRQRKMHSKLIDLRLCGYVSIAKLTRIREHLLNYLAKHSDVSTPHSLATHPLLGWSHKSSRSLALRSLEKLCDGDVQVYRQLKDADVDVFEHHFREGRTFVYALTDDEFGFRTADFSLSKLGDMLTKEQLNEIVYHTLDGDKAKGITWADFKMCFESVEGTPLKIKDYPPHATAKSVLKQIVDKFLRLQPFACYTHPDGALNLLNALRPREVFLPGDFSVKIYIAVPTNEPFEEPAKIIYSTGTHQDIADAYNVLVHIGNAGKKMKQDKREEHEEKVMNYLKKLHELGELGKDQWIRVNNAGFDKIGALWHLWDRRFAKALCAYAQNKQQINGEEVTFNPIHDQLSYFNADDRKSLAQRGVPVRTVVQLLGDTVFIPAGCVHQVQNLNSCVKFAGDFITPQSMETIVELADQFRLLPQTHANSGDRLSVPHIVYQAVKNALVKNVNDDDRCD